MSKFFEFGDVQLEAVDESTQQISIKVCLPSCLMQTISPIMLHAGIIDDYELRNPIAVWIPKITNKRIQQSVMNNIESIQTIIENETRSIVEKNLRFFKEISPALINPSDLIPMLPMGTYVTFRFRSTIDSLVLALEKLNGIKNIAGMSDFCFATADVLAQIMTKLG